MNLSRKAKLRRTREQQQDKLLVASFRVAAVLQAPGARLFAGPAAKCAAEVAWIRVAEVRGNVGDRSVRPFQLLASLVESYFIQDSAKAQAVRGKPTLQCAYGNAKTDRDTPH